VTKQHKNDTETLAAQSQKSGKFKEFTMPQILAQK
jgi:hypothetical protein